MAKLAEAVREEFLWEVQVSVGPGEVLHGSTSSSLQKAGFRDIVPFSMQPSGR